MDLTGLQDNMLLIGGKMRSTRKHFFKQKEQENRRKYRKRERLLDASANLGWLELEKPIRKGYEKILVPRKDYLQRQDIDYFKELTEIVQPRYLVHSMDRNFLKRDIESDELIELRAEPRELSKKEFDEILPKFRKEFELGIREKREFGITKREQICRVIKPWRFVYKIIPYYLTHVRKSDPELDRLISDLNN